MQPKGSMTFDTETTYASNLSYAWFVYFGYGLVGGSNKDFTTCVRAVRAGL